MIRTRIHTRNMAELMRIRIPSSYTAGTFHSCSHTDGTCRIRNNRADMRADVLAD
jgi:hypothetical protein